MTLDFLRRAVRDGPRAFPVGEYGTLAWFAGAFLWWELWAIGAATVVALELAYRAMAALHEPLAVPAILAIGYALCEVSCWITSDEGVGEA